VNESGFSYYGLSFDENDAAVFVAFSCKIFHSHLYLKIQQQLAPILKTISLWIIWISKLLL